MSVDVHRRHVLQVLDTLLLAELGRVGHAAGRLRRLGLGGVVVVGALEVAVLVVDVDEGLERGVLLEEHVALEEPRRGLGDLVAGELGGGDGEDVVELL